MIEDKQTKIEELQLKYNQLESKLFDYEKTKGFDKPLSGPSHKDFEEKKTKKIVELEHVINNNNETILALKMRLHELESNFEFGEGKKLTKNPEKLEDNYEKALLDHEELKDERDQLKEAMNEAINQCANSLVKQQSLEKENQKLLKQVENLANSKLLMQSTMADQINSLRGQVQRLKEERNENSIRVSNEY